MRSLDSTIDRARAEDISGWDIATFNCRLLNLVNASPLQVIATAKTTGINPPLQVFYGGWINSTFRGGLRGFRSIICIIKGSTSNILSWGLGDEGRSKPNIMSLSSYLFLTWILTSFGYWRWGSRVTARSRLIYLRSYRSIIIGIGERLLYFPAPLLPLWLDP